MKLINQEADFALKALLTIAGRDGQVTSVAGLVGTLGIPRPYLRKIMQRLAREGIVRSFKGRGGGFVLGRPAGKISLADVIHVFQGPTSFENCLFKTRICPDVRTCPLRKAIGRLENRLAGELKALSIASLAEGDKGWHDMQKTHVQGEGPLNPRMKRR
jgi:Rrf2 family protein